MVMMKECVKMRLETCCSSFSPWCSRHTEESCCPDLLPSLDHPGNLPKPYFYPQLPSFLPFMRFDIFLGRAESSSLVSALVQ